MAYAEYLAGIAFNNASLGYVHAMAHQLGGFYNLPHGVCNAILLPVVMEYNSSAVPELYIDLAEVGGWFGGKGRRVPSNSNSGIFRRGCLLSRVDTRAPDVHTRVPHQCL